MEFLQRHLPRVYQAVQSALDYITNMTAQIFGAPPNAPQPGASHTRTPLQSQDAAVKSQGTDQMTLATDVTSEEAALEATEESMTIYGIQQDDESQARETAVRYRKENVDRRHHGYHHTISNANDTFNHQDESHRKATTPHDQEPPKPEVLEDISCKIVTEILHAEVHPDINEEVQKANLETLMSEVQNRNKTENKSISRLEYLLRDLETKSYQEPEVSPTGDQVPRSSLDLEIEENSCSNVNVSPHLGKTITIQEISEEAPICQLTVTLEEGDQEPPEDVLATPLIMDYDDLDLPDIKRQHKKLVTPVSAEDKSPSDQGEEARKTWEHLQETAVRLAMQCDLFQGKDQESEALESEDITKNIHEDKISVCQDNKQVDSEEYQENTSHDQKEVKELSSEEKGQSEEVSSVSKLGEDCEPAEQGQRVEKMRRRVHFSPSVEERDQISADIVCMKWTHELMDHPSNLHPRPESGELPINREEDFGFISSNQVIEASMIDQNTESDQMKPLNPGSTVWYDELEMSTHTNEETCQSIDDVTYQSVTLGFQSEEVTNIFPDQKSLEERSNDVLTVGEMMDGEEEQNKHSMPALDDRLTHSEVDCEVEYDHEEGTQRFDKTDGPLEKSYEVVSDFSNQEVSTFTELKVTVSLEVESQSSEEIKVDLLLNEDTESMNKKVHAEVDYEDTDSKEKLLQLSRCPLVEEDSTEGGVTPMTDELNLHEGRLKDGPDGAREPTVSVYTPDEENMKTSVQELDTSKSNQLDYIISTESEGRLLTDSSNIDNVQTAEDPSEEGSEGSVRTNRPMKTQNEEDMSGKEYHDIDILSQIKTQSQQVEGHMRVKTEYQIEEMDDYMWYKQESYQNDGLITYSDSFEDPGSQKNPTDKAEESSEQLPYEEFKSEVNSKDGVGGQPSQKVICSDENATKDSDLHIVSETEPRNQGLSRYTENALGSDDELEGICRYAETGFNLLSEIHSVINTSQSEQDVSEVVNRSEITHCVSTEGNFLEDTTESKLQIHNVVKDLDLQCIVSQGHPVDKTSEDLPGENQTSLTSDETLGDQSLERVKEVKISLDTGTFNRSEVILDQHFLSELHSVIQSLDHPAEVLEIMSTMNVGQSDKGVEYVGHANEEILEPENIEESSPDLHLSEELGYQLESVQTFEEYDYSSICIASTETMIEVSDINLDTNNTSVEIAENKEEEEDGKAEDQSFVILDETSNGHFGDQILDSVKELEILLQTESPVEDNIEVIMGSVSESCSDTVEGGDDQLSSMDTSVGEIVSTIIEGQSDKEVEDVRYSNEETIAEILSEEITSDSEEHILGLHLSEKLGTLLEPKQIFKEEDYSSMGMAVNDTIIEASDVGLETHNTPVEILDISENKKEDAEKDQSFDTLDETSNELLGDQNLDRVKEREVLLESGSPTEDNIEVIMGSMLYSETLEGGDDLSFNMHPSEEEVKESPMNVEVSDKLLEDEGQSDDPTIVDIFSETFEHQEKPMENYPEMCFSSKLGTIEDLEHSLEEHTYSSLIVTKTQVEATQLNNYSTETENVLSKEIDPSTEIYNDLILDHTVETTSESKEESQPYKTVDNTFRKQFGNLEVHEPVTHTETGSVAEYIDLISESTSEYSIDEGGLLSDLPTVKMTDHQIDVISVVSSTGKEDMLDTRKAHDILVESTIPVDIISDNVIPDEQGNDTSDICHVEEFGSSFEPSQEPEENQPNSSSRIFIEESHIGLGIVNTVEENVIVPLEDYEPKQMDLLSEIQSMITSDYSVEASTRMSSVEVVEVAEEDFFTRSIAPEENEDSEETQQKLGSSEPGKDMEKKLHGQDSSQPTLSIITHHSEDITSVDIKEFTKTAHFGSSDLELRLPPSVDLIKQEAIEGEEHLSSKEALCSYQNKQVITITTEKPIQLIEPPTHMEVNEDQEKPLVDHKGTMKEPSLEEDDDIDSSLFPHNMLDISAQKSRVQLRRKTSIRRKQGQQQGPTESEPIEPPKPIPRPRPMGVPIFPGNMPIFPMVPARTPSISHTTEEQKEERSAEAEAILIKPKKGIPRHAG